MTALTFDELKSKYQNKPQINSEVKCKLLAKLKEGCVVDINGEWEGFIPASHVTPDLENNSHEFSALIISGADKSDRFVISPRALKERRVWDELKSLKEGNTLIKVRISKPVKGGAEVFIEGVRGFIPGRYIRLPGLSPETWPSQEITVLIEELNYEEKKLILNQRKAWELQRQKQAIAVLQKLREGDILEVSVVRIADFGVFVDLGGIDGLIPASELSWGRFSHPTEIVQVGQILRARIFRIERENQRIALSVKQLLGDPWEEINLNWQIGKQLKGKIIGGAKFGYFVELKPGIEALLHNSEIPEGVEKPKEGDIIEAKIIKLDVEQRRIGLSLRNLESLAKPVQELSTQEVPAIQARVPDVIEEKSVNDLGDCHIVLQNGNLSNIDEEKTEG